MLMLFGWKKRSADKRSGPIFTGPPVEANPSEIVTVRPWFRTWTDEDGKVQEWWGERK